MPILTLQTTANADDGKILGSSFSTSGTLYVGKAADPASLFARFLNVAIPKNAQINSAYLQYYAVSSNSGTCLTKIYGNAEDNAVSPISLASYNGKAVTSASTAWTIPAWTSLTWYNSPDITTIVQEIVNRSGWVSGNALMILHKDDGSSPDALRQIADYTYSGNVSGPKLVIDYTESVTQYTKTISSTSKTTGAIQRSKAYQKALSTNATATSSIARTNVLSKALSAVAKSTGSMPSKKFVERIPGARKLSQITVFDSAEHTVAFLSNDLPEACKILSCRQHQIALEGGAYADTLIFSADATHPDAALIVKGGFVGFTDPDGLFQMYEIVEDVKEDSASHILTATCEHAYYELLDEPIYDVRPTNASAGSAAEQLLAGTRWELGTADDLGVNSVRAYYSSVLAGLVEIATRWGGELRFRLHVTGGVIDHRYVDILAQRGAVTGKQFIYGKDLISIKHTSNTQGLATALIGRGKGVEIPGDDPANKAYGRRVNFADVVWSVANGNPCDKPAGQEWVGDDTALAIWGRAGGTRHRTAFVNFDDITDPEELVHATWDELQRRKLPRDTYELDVIQLEGLTGYAHEAVRLGDTNTIINTAYSPASTGTARIFDLDRNLLDLSDAKAILGNYIPTVSDNTIAQKLALQAMQDRQGVWDNSNAITTTPNGEGALQYAVDLLKTQLFSTISGFSTDVNGNYIWENPEKTKALMIGAGIFAIANTKSSGAYNWRTFGSGDGFTADEMTAGRMTASRITVGSASAFDAGYNPSTKETPAGAQAKADAAYAAAQSFTNSVAADLQSQIDGSITTWFKGYVPTLLNLPASDWNTVELKNQHLADICYDTVTGHAYRFLLDAGVYSWVEITDSDVTKALADAARAQDTADGKRRVFTTTPTVPYDAGDLWAAGAAGDIKRCIVQRLTGVYTASDWELASKYTDDTAVNTLAGNLGDMAYQDVVELAKLGTTIIQGGYLQTVLLLADAIRGGTMTLGGPVGSSTYDGKVDLKDALGALYGRLDRRGLAFIDASGAETRIATTTANVTITIGTGQTYTTIQSFVDTIPMIGIHDIYITLANQTFDEDVAIKNKLGNGRITIEGSGSSVVRSISIANCDMEVYLENITLTRTSGLAFSISAGYASLQNITVSAATAIRSGIQFWQSKGQIIGCSVSNRNTGIVLVDASDVQLWDCIGTGNQTGIEVNSSTMRDGGGNTITGTLENRNVLSFGFIVPSEGLDLTGNKSSPYGLVQVKYLGNSTHMNEVTIAGRYGMYDRAESPSGSIGVMDVLVYSQDWIVQRWYPIGASNPNGYQRMFHSGTTWTSWRTL